MSDVISLTFHALAPLFLLIGLGYGLKRWAILRHEHVPTLNLLVINALLPATILRALIHSPRLTPAALLAPLILLVAELAVVGVVVLLFRRRDAWRERIGASALTSAFGNTAFLGYPIAQAVTPNHFAAAVLIDEFGMTLGVYPVAAALGSAFAPGQGRRPTLRESSTRFARSPLFLALVAGVILRAIPTPGWLVEHDVRRLCEQCLDYLSSGTTPVVLLALGLALEPRGGDGATFPLVIVAAAKLFALPALVWALAWACGVHGELRTTLVLQAAMPAAVVSAILSQEFGLGGKFAVRSVFLTTCLAAVTLPLWAYALRTWVR